MFVEFENKDRSRRYGIRKGDIVEERAYGSVIRGEVISIDFSDNNACLVRRESDGREIRCVCEWCDIIIKVEDRKDYNT